MAHPPWKFIQTRETRRTGLLNGERSVHLDNDVQDEAWPRLGHWKHELLRIQGNGPYWEDHIVPNRISVPICHHVLTRTGILQFSWTEPLQPPMVWDVQHQGRYQIRYWSHNTAQSPAWICRSGNQHQVLWDVHRRTRGCQVKPQRKIFIIRLPQKERQTTQQTEDWYSEQLHNRLWQHSQYT